VGEREKILERIREGLKVKAPRPRARTGMIWPRRIIRPGRFPAFANGCHRWAIRSMSAWRSFGATVHRAEDGIFICAIRRRKRCSCCGRSRKREGFSARGQSSRGN